MKEFLTTLLKSLDSLSVKGKDNMDILLGCMMAIERKIVELNTHTESKDADGEMNGR